MSIWKLNFTSRFVFCISYMLVSSKEKTFQRDTTKRLHYVIFKDHLFYALEVKRIETGFAETKKHCLLECVKNQECFSTNIRANSGPDGKSPCESFPCQHGGTCQALYETNDYSCNCTKDYTGIDSGEFLPCGVDQDWKHFDSSCYRYFSEALSWSEASSRCKELNGSLGIFHTAEEYEFVTTTVLPAVRYAIWIGLSDYGQGTSRDWKWQDDSGLTFSRWFSGFNEPNHPSEDCVGVYLGQFHDKWWNHDWHDFTCTKAFSFICERSSRLETDPLWAL